MAALTPEQTLIRDQARAWVKDKASIKHFRRVRDAGLALGYDSDTWAAMVELGWAGLLVPESHGGSGLDYMSFGLILEALGRELTASPLFASAYVGVSALLLAGDPTQRAALLPEIAAGREILTLAVDEGPRHAPEEIALRAEPDGNGFRLSGRKGFVLEGMAATRYVLAARSRGQPGDVDGITLFLVPARCEGLQRGVMGVMDSRGYARLQLDGVRVDHDAVLGEVDAGFTTLEAILDRARAGLSAEMLGTGSAAFDMTLEYLKTRKQFGQVIGSFQALGHRAAELFSSMELARSCMEAALRSIDQNHARGEAVEDTEVARNCAMAKAKVGDFLYAMSNQLIQIHGGIGMTDEFDAGLYLKRARVLESTYGNRAWQRDRFATLLGF